MNLRGQIILSSLLLTLLPLLLVFQLIRTDVRQTYTQQNTQRVEEQTRLIRQDLDRKDQELIARLDALTQQIGNDNNFRLAALGGSPEQYAYLRDFAGRHMSLMDLDMLLIQDEAGKVLSSGHFRGTFGETNIALPRALTRAIDGRALLQVRTPVHSFLALARSHTISLGGRNFYVTGGVKFDQEEVSALDQNSKVAVALVWDGGMLTTNENLISLLGNDKPYREIEYVLHRAGLIVRSQTLSFIIDEALQTAHLVVTHDQTDLQSLLGGLNRTLILVMALALAISLVLSIILAGRISRPLRDLAERTANLDLDQLDVDFRSRRKDEVGRLSRLMGDMTERLRDGVVRLKKAEHHATLGEVARQVNHDIRNGITPLRNVIRHLEQVSENDQGSLEEIFSERKDTLKSGLDYLEDLASHYARLSPQRRPQPCHLADMAESALGGTVGFKGITLTNNTPSGLPPIEADPISLRRVLDNLIRNARESLPTEGGAITLGANLIHDEIMAEDRLELSITDNGCGIPEDKVDQIFNDFYTTKEAGTGLGLSNVRRLVADDGGRVRVASVVGEGTTFTLSFPVPRLAGS
jgi:signal transduction histidine kinase